jgi:hypothetical protein
MMARCLHHIPSMILMLVQMQQHRPSYWTPTWVLVPLVVYIVWLLAPGCLGFREMVDLMLALTCPRRQHWHLRAASSTVGLTYALQVTLIACLMWWRSLLCQFLLLWKVTYQMTTAVLHAVGLHFNWRMAQFTGRIAIIAKTQLSQLYCLKPLWS